MKIQFVSVMQNSFINEEGIYREMPLVPSLGDLIEFSKEEVNKLRCKLQTDDGSLLIVVERVIKKDNSICITVCSDEMRKIMNYKNHLIEEK